MGSTSPDREEAFDRNILIQIWPMDPDPTTDQSPVASLLLGCFDEPRKPSQRSADFSPIGEDNMQHIGSDRNVDSQRLKPNA
jgi:hypothetical protein